MTYELSNPPYRADGAKLEIEHCSWFVDGVSHGIAPSVLAARMGIALNVMLRALSTHGDEIESLITGALRLSIIGKAHTLTAIADGPQNPDYVGNGDIDRDKLRISVIQHLLGALTKISPKQRVETTVSINLTSSLSQAVARVRTVDATDAQYREIPDSVRQNAVLLPLDVAPAEEIAVELRNASHDPYLRRMPAAMRKTLVTDWAELDAYRRREEIMQSADRSAAPTVETMSIDTLDAMLEGASQ